MKTPLHFLLLNILCLLSVVCNSQTIQPIFFNNSNDEGISSFIETENKDIVGVGYTRKLNWGDNAITPKLWLISSNKDTLTKTFNFSDSIASFNKIFRNDNDTYHIFGRTIINNDINKYSIFFLEMDNKLSILNKKLFRFEGWERINVSLTTKINNKYYLFGTVKNNHLQQNEIRKTFVLVTDLNFNVIKSKIYEDIYVKPGASYFSCMASPDETQLWLVAKGIENLTPNLASYPTFLVFDTNLNIVSHKAFPFYIDPNLGHITVDYNFPLNAKLITDSTFIVCGANQQTYAHPTQIYHMIGLSELDTSMTIAPITYVNKMLDTLTYPAEKNCMDFIDPNQIYFAGVKKKNSIDNTWLLIGKANRNLEVSKIIYYGGDATYSPTEIKCLSESVCLTGRKTDKFYYGYNVLFNIQNEAFDSHTLSKPTVELNNNKFLSVYPNPFNEFIEVKIDKPCRFNIYNSAGIIMFSENLISNENRIYTQNFKTGMYICEAINENGEKSIVKIIKQ